MPQAWMTSHAVDVLELLVIARGQAEPPMTTRFEVGSLPPVASRCCSSISQTVGTAAVKVTRSSLSSS